MIPDIVVSTTVTQKPVAAMPTHKGGPSQNANEPLSPTVATLSAWERKHVAGFADARQVSLVSLWMFSPLT